MPEKSLQFRQTSAVHNVMAGESVAQIVDSNFSHVSLMAKLNMKLSYFFVFMSGAIGSVNQRGAYRFGPKPLIISFTKVKMDLEFFGLVDDFCGLIFIIAN